MDWNKVKAALKARGVPVPADENQLLGVALMNLGLLDEEMGTWVREQRVTPGEYKPKGTDLPEFDPVTGKLRDDGLPTYKPNTDVFKKVDDSTGTGPESSDVDPATVRNAAGNIQSNSLKRGPYKLTIPGLAADSSTGDSKMPTTPAGPKPMPPGWTPPPPMEYARSQQYTPEEFMKLPRERQLQLLNPFEEGGNYSPYTDPQRGTFDASGAWIPFDYSGYAGLLSEMGRKTDYAGKYGQQVADTFSQQYMNSLEDATGDEADFVKANLKNYLTDPGNPAYSMGYQGRNGPADPVGVLQGVFQKNKGKGDDPDQIAAKELGASRAASRKARRFGTDTIPAMADGTVDMDVIVPLLQKILSAVGGDMDEEMGEEEDDAMPTFGGDCESPEKGMALVISKEEDDGEEEDDMEEEDDGLPRFAEGTIKAPGDTMPVFKPPKVSQPNATWLKQPPVARATQGATAQPPVTVNVNAAPRQEAPAPRQNANLGPIAVPGAEPGIFVNQNQPGDQYPYGPPPTTEPSPNPNPNPAPNPTPDPTPNPNPDDVEDGPVAESDNGQNREPTMEDVVAIKGSANGQALRELLSSIFPGQIALDEAKLFADKDAIALLMMKVMAGEMTAEAAASQIYSQYKAGDSTPDTGNDTPDTTEPPPSTDPAPDQPGTDSPADDAPSNFTATDIAYLNQLSQSQIPSWRALARSYLGSKGVPMDGVSDDMLTANIEKAYSLIRGTDGKAPAGDIAKVLKGESLPPTDVEDAPAPETPVTAASSASASTAASTPASSTSATTPSNSTMVQLGNGFVLDTVRNVIIDTATGKEYSAGGATGGNDAPTQVIYGTDAWKNNPTLMFINKLLGNAGFDKLGGMPSYDPFYKTTLAAPNAMNYGDMLKVLQDPTSAAIADAIFKRHNRSLAGDVIRAGQYAPLGDARYTGEIRTG